MIIFRLNVAFKIFQVILMACFMVEETSTVAMVKFSVPYPTDLWQECHKSSQFRRPVSYSNWEVSG